MRRPGTVRITGKRSDPILQQRDTVVPVLSVTTDAGTVPDFVPASIPVAAIMSEMNNIQARQAEYAGMHAKLADRMQSVRVILEQMSEQEYAAFSTYTNNMEVIARFY